MPSALARRSMTYCLVLDILLSTYLGSAVVSRFYKHHGMSQTQISIVLATIAIVTFAADTPCGHVADRFGKSHIILIGTSMQTAQSLFFPLSSQFWQFEMIAVFTSISWCFINNTTSSIMQSQANIPLFEQYKKRVSGLKQVGRIIGTLAGGWLTSPEDTSLPFVVQPSINILALLVALRLFLLVRRLPRARYEYNALRDMIDTVGLMLGSLPQVRWLVILTAINNAAFLGCFWLLQPQFEAMYVPLWLYGPLYAARSAIVIVLVWRGGIILRLGRFTIQAIILGSIVATALLAGLELSWASITLLIIGSAFAEGFVELVQETTLVTLLPEKYAHHRTTQLSVNTSAKSLAHALAIVLIGRAVDCWSIGSAFLAIAACSLVMGSCALYRLHVAHQRADEQHPATTKVKERSPL